MLHAKIIVNTDDSTSQPDMDRSTFGQFLRIKSPYVAYHCSCKNIYIVAIPVS